MIALYVTNLGKYNQGYLVYERLELPYYEGELEEVLEAIGINEDYEEWFISDYETDLEIKIGEYSNIEYLNDFVKEIEGVDINIINGIAEHHTDNPEEILSIIRNESYSILSNVETEHDLGLAIAEEFHNVSLNDFISSYIDYEQIGRDSGYTFMDGSMALEIY